MGNSEAQTAIDLTIPDAAYDAAETVVKSYAAKDSEDFALDVASDAINIAAPLIVAAELRRLADELDVQRLQMCAEAYRSVRSSGLAVGIERLRQRADELDRAQS